MKTEEKADPSATLGMTVLLAFSVGPLGMTIACARDDNLNRYEWSLSFRPGKKIAAWKAAVRRLG